MKDWEINHNNWYPSAPDFVHKCTFWADGTPKLINQVMVNSKGKWYCTECGKEPPEEIAFCADLAGCWDGTPE